MITLVRMGRKKLGRVKRNITLPLELAEQADEVAASEGRPLSHLIESLLKPYMLANWKEAAKSQKRRKA